MITSDKDVADACDAGRRHVQRFLKNAGLAGDAHWQDWSYASGQPAYDARIGDALTFTPFVATRNDAIYFPPIAADQARYVYELSVYATAGGTGQTSVECEMYDLLGVYPLIDGDNTDEQPMDNAATLPRYTDGVGVRAVLVNHVSPAVSAGSALTITYTGADDVQRQMVVYSTLFGLGKACASLDTSGVSTSMLYLPADGGGVKTIDAVQFATAPGGLWAIYLVKPLQRIPWRGGLSGVTQTVMAEKSIALQDSWSFPQVLDGAWLGFFYLPTGSARTVALYGTVGFIWG